VNLIRQGDNLSVKAPRPHIPGPNSRESAMAQTPGGQRLHVAAVRDDQAGAAGVARDAADGQRAHDLGQRTRIGAVGLAGAFNRRHPGPGAGVAAGGDGLF